MKKCLLLVAIILPFILSSCVSNGKSRMEQELIGEWYYSVRMAGNYNEYHYQYNSDHTGSYWTVENGIIKGKTQMTWSISWSRDKYSSFLDDDDDPFQNQKDYHYYLTTETSNSTMKAIISIYNDKMELRDPYNQNLHMTLTRVQ